MARPIVLLKLGGSLITDKTRSSVARRAVILRLAREVASACQTPRGPRILLGHGSGSYGHTVAAKGGLVRGADARRRVDTISRTQVAAAKLHHLMVAALADAGARPFSFAPSSFLHSARGRTDRFVEPIFASLNRGLLPVVYGDVVLDDTRGAVVVSTEELFLILAKEAASRGIPVARAVWLGETDGLRGADGRTVEALSAEGALRAARRANGASGTDVTGGMALRLRTAGALARAGISSYLVDGRTPHALERAVAGSLSGGTRVGPR